MIVEKGYRATYMTVVEGLVQGKFFFIEKVRSWKLKRAKPRGSRFDREFTTYVSFFKIETEIAKMGWPNNVIWFKGLGMIDLKISNHILVFKLTRMFFTTQGTRVYGKSRQNKFLISKVTLLFWTPFFISQSKLSVSLNSLVKNKLNFNQKAAFAPYYLSVVGDLYYVV